MDFKNKKNIMKKLVAARKEIASKHISKDGENTFSKYSYFTPAMVTGMVSQACEKAGITTLYFCEYLPETDKYKAELYIIDVESGEDLCFSMVTEKAEIKGTSETQKIGGTMTYTERYLKQFAFEIAENNLDLDNNKEFKEKEKKEDFTTKKKMMGDFDYENILGLFAQGKIDKAVAVKNTFNFIPEKYKPGLKQAWEDAQKIADEDLEFNKILDSK